MRSRATFALATTVFVLATGVALAQQTPTTVAAAPSNPPVPSSTTCANPDAIGLARTVEIDTTGGPGFGFEHFKQHDFLRAGEVVLTFDDGPWPGTTASVLRTLADHCIKATFFPVGKHAIWHPEILKQVVAAGHSVGTHTWSHRDLSKKSIDEAKDEIEKGISAVRLAAGVPTAPFFRFPALRHPPELVTYMGERNVGIFSTDIDSFDFTTRRPEQVIAKVMDKLKRHGKGMVLMHDFQQVTAKALPDLLARLKADGYKIVHMRGKDPLQSLAAYDALIVKEAGLSTVSSRPTSSVVRTVE